MGIRSAAQGLWGLGRHFPAWRPVLCSFRLKDTAFGQFLEWGWGSWSVLCLGVCICEHGTAAPDLLESQAYDLGQMRTLQRPTMGQGAGFKSTWPSVQGH